ncbi:hypothetical protein BDD12DRAFT_983623 [Trichophaea hybrida]|nr:hypothetical protein BDD12DRAFT_983623 [Trichophaea hybrida]
MGNRYEGATHFEFHNPTFNDGQRFIGYKRPIISGIRIRFPWFSRSKKPKHEPFGLLQLYPSPNSKMEPEIEIVAIHGLGGGRMGTFTSASGVHLWLRDFLPEDPDVAHMKLRISTFGYDASVAFGDSAIQIHNFAGQLLDELHHTRRESETTRVPIVIIAHSLGGFVAKQVLIMAQNLQQDYGEIKESMKSVDLAKVMTIRGVRRNLLKALEPKSQELTNISSCFERQTMPVQIVSMYEQNPTKKKILLFEQVDEASATLGIPNERLFAIPRDHFGICQYTSPREDAYATVSKAIVGSFQEIHRRLQELEECLRSLYFQEYQTRRLNISERDACTFKWIREHPGFVEWENSTSSSLLWLQGKPASGKSTLMKYIRMDLDNRPPDLDTENGSERIVIDFFYSERGGDAQRGHEWMLRSLLYQLLSMRHDMWDFYRGKFEDFKQQDPQHWHLKLLEKTFSIIKTKCRLPLTIYVLIDAMDESDKPKREEILNLLSSVCDSEGSGLVMKILIASRPIPKITSVLKKYITITLEEETTKDIDRFTSKRMEEINKILDAHTTKVQDIHHMIVKRSRGVFLWVKLVLNELEDMAHNGCSLFEIKRKLEYLPQDLDDLYALMLEKLGTAEHAETLRMLQWVAHSSRPLSLIELIEAVVVAVSDPLDISLDLLEERRAPTLDQANRMVSTKFHPSNGPRFLIQTACDILASHA